MGNLRFAAIQPTSSHTRKASAQQKASLARPGPVLSCSEAHTEREEKPNVAAG